VESNHADGRFVGLIVRDLGASQVRFLPSHTPAPVTDNTLHARLPDGRIVVATFEAIPENRDALARRLEMLASSFAQVGTQEGEHKTSQSSPPRSLREELRALATRAMALDAVVVDSQSPVVWASASNLFDDRENVDDLGLVRHDVSSPMLARGKASHDWSEDSGALPTEDESANDEQDHAETSGDPFESAATLRAARGAVESWREHHARARGTSSTHHAYTAEDCSYFATHFSGIYALIVVYESQFDEIRAHRAVAESLSRIERLVLALPPFDPGPSAGAGAAVVTPFRRRRR
jgi:hypothetical protein